MTSTHPNGEFRLTQGDTVHDTRSNRFGIVTHDPEPGAWVCLGHPDDPADVYRRWHALYGDIQPTDSHEEPA
ncbi:hypothetical protein QIS99_18760 [Streptomyces sp. B-S-A8]|uniref:Uncharacterized protein n=1 Tax=Streptomyces solicavernae TaxID=3043614 RepID=A0ABT6RV74_9ACTN|nr:hypothetical protein [Streptomyces sp. B-S-A8]MDI3388230.1 hypothetical protein [Streptomyces sp. B-S-A8]